MHTQNGKENIFEELIEVENREGEQWRERFVQCVRKIVEPNFRNRIPSKLRSVFSEEDVAQETAVKLLSVSGQFNVSVGATAAYINTVAKRVLIDLVRTHLAGKRSPAGGFANVSLSSSMNLLNDVTNNDKTPSQLEVLKELWTLVNSVLNEQEEQIVQLFYIEGLTTSDIAMLFDKTDSAIRSQLSRIRQKLFETLSQRADFESFC